MREKRDLLAEALYAVNPDKRPWDGEVYAWREACEMRSPNYSLALAQADAIQEMACESGEDARWGVGVDWLLNHVDVSDFAVPFYAFVDGLISEAELRAESVGVAEINRRRDAQDLEAFQRGVGYRPAPGEATHPEGLVAKRRPR